MTYLSTQSRKPHSCGADARWKTATPTTLWSLGGWKLQPLQHFGNLPSREAKYFEICRNQKFCLFEKHKSKIFWLQHNLLCCRKMEATDVGLCWHHFGRIIVCASTYHMMLWPFFLKHLLTSRLKCRVVITCRAATSVCGFLPTVVTNSAVFSESEPVARHDHIQRGP